MNSRRTSFIVLAGMTLALQAPGAHAADGEAATAVPPPPALQVSLEIGGEGFRWREFDDAGRRLLTEQGLRYRAALSVHNLPRIDSGLLYALAVNGYTGVVDYDGQDTNRRFIGSSTEYGGYGIEATAGYRLARPAAPVALDVIAGIGVERWERDIRGGINAAGFPVAGLVEEYAITYGRVGLGISRQDGGPRSHLGIGYRFPLRNREEVPVRGEPVVLEPGKAGSAWIAWKVSLDPSSRGQDFGTFLRLSYESYRFGRSPSRTVGNLTVWQPESDMDVIGITLGFSY